MVSKKLVLSADGATATVANAEFADIFTTALSTGEALTGMYKYAQLALVGLSTAMVANRRHSGSFTNFG